MKTHPSASTIRLAGILALSLGFAAASPGAHAQQNPMVGYEDIDLFVNPPSASDLPNVLLVLDTSANWSANAANACTTYDDGTPGPTQNNPGREQGYKIAIQKCALVNTLLSLQPAAGEAAKFRVGLMYMNAPNVDGAYPRLRFLEFDAANAPALIAAVKDTWISAETDQGSNADYSRALWEAYLWYKGMAPYRGYSPSSKSFPKTDVDAFDADKKYISPAATNCGRNYVIVISNGSPQSAENDVQPLVKQAGGNATQIGYPQSYIGTADQNNWADETARFLRGTDVSSMDGNQGVITYTIAITSANPTPSETRSNNYIKEIAVQGGGMGFTASNVDELKAKLKSIFDQIQAANSVFASASLPVSVNAQGTFLNQVFMGMFRPDEIARPRWVGNLKQYQFGYNAATQQVSLVDATGKPAVNPATGFIDPSAHSFWTSADPYTDFWKKKQWGIEVNVGGSSDLPDGQLVEKGGAAQRLRESFLTDTLRVGRKVYTCTNCTSLTTFDTSHVSAADLDVADNTARNELVEWVRGKDNKVPSDEGGPGTLTKTDGTEVTPTVRATIHGDVIHSSPAVINHGNGNIVVYYGTNGGMLHAVNGTKTGSVAGNELWSFIPSEFLPKLKRLRNNAPKVMFAATDMTEYPDAQRKDYAMDGPLTFYQKLGSGAKVYLYAAMRRGGRALYAFDVTAPESPQLLWKVSNETSGLEALGQTWSEARVTRIDGVANPVIIMGGGYDPGEDETPAATTTMGNVVVVLDAFTGKVLRVFTGIARPVPAAVATVDDSGDGKMDRAYAVDLGGNVYRMVFPSADPAGWQLTKVADFGISSGSGQKMFYAPAVTITKVGDKTTYAVQVGTGDREKPLKASGTENRFYTVFDRGQSAAVGLSDLIPMTAAGLESIPADKYGCYYNLPHAGEKVVNAVTYTSGFAFFGTNAPTPPSPTSCTGSLGIARSYAIPALCGPVQISELEGGGFPPTAVVGRVLIPPPLKAGETEPADCELNPAKCLRVPVGIGINPPDCQGNLSLISSSIGATNIYACAPPQRLRRDWSIANPR